MNHFCSDLDSKFSMFFYASFLCIPMQPLWLESTLFSDQFRACSLFFGYSLLLNCQCIELSQLVSAFYSFDRGSQFVTANNTSNSLYFRFVLRWFSTFFKYLHPIWVVKCIAFVDVLTPYYLSAITIWLPRPNSWANQ